MGVSVNSGLTVANITTSASNKTILYANATRTTAGATAILTTTAGKTTRIIGMELMSSASSAALFTASITIDGATALKIITCNAQNAQTSFNGDYTNAIPVAANKVINLVTADSAFYGSANIFYIEEWIKWQQRMTI